MSKKEGKAIGFEKPAVGAAVKVEAVDWGLFSEQYPEHTQFSIVRGTVYGRVVCVDDEKIAVAMQIFEDGGTRCVLSIPFCTVIRITILESAL